MTWLEVEQTRKLTDTVLIPIGQIAQHGRHLPLSTDVIQAEEASRRAIAKLVAVGTFVALGPTIPYGHSPTHYAFPGYISLRPETFTLLIKDVIESLARQGFRRFIIFNVGGGNWGGIENASFHAHFDLGVEVFVLGWFEMSPIWGPLLETHHPEVNEHDGHSGELETSCVLAVAPGLVALDKLEHHRSPLAADVANLPFANMNVNERFRAIGCWNMQEVGPNGMWGDATAATAEKGELIYDAVAEALTRHIRKYVFRVL
jgi:creatinine amidohydrolase